MKTRRDDTFSLVRNPLSLLGAILAVLGLGGLVFVLGISFLQVRPSAYVSAFAVIFLPALVVMGLLVIPAGMLWEHRRRARAARRGEGMRPALRIDFEDPRHVRAAAFFSIATVVILAVLGASAYRAVEFMDSPTFCGETCHQVMAPQYETYKESPHAEVACTYCHIGPGADWYVQSKLSGGRQVLATLLDTYPRPIPAPIENLRPSRDTCEDCHWRERAYGLRLRVFHYYLADEDNTLEIFPLVFRVGTGGDRARGVHWHTSARLWYRPATEDRQTIAWVGLEEDGEIVREFVNPKVESGAPEMPRRLMDCIDCHNRAAHDIPSPVDLVDEALAAGRLDSSLPYLKRQSLRLLMADQADPDANELRALWTEDWFQQLARFYEEEYPDVAREKADSIQQAIDELERISEEVIYPGMNSTWRTYPENLGHPGAGKGDPGCFRCHGALVEATTGEPIRGSEQGLTDCVACHKPGAITEDPAIGGIHVLGPGEGCDLCHFIVPLEDIPAGVVDLPVR
ncbi:MAG: NapC/NirT family cytochrome c [Dehalococcoidia bacterium]|nr:NapC/NirT family cytochrome c [Dehalococcoidia bacterium]